MTREIAKSLLAAITYFTNGGTLLMLDVYNKWITMSDEIIFQWRTLPSYIMDDSLVEGKYYVEETEARKEYYNIQKTLAWTNMDNKKRLYMEAKASYDRCVQILKEIE